MAKIETPEEKKSRETVESIATTITKLSENVAALLKGPLNRKALVTLLASSSGMSKHDIGLVLTALEDLKKDWLN